MIKMILNPFYAYSIIYSIVLLVYLFPFSNLFPELSFPFFVYFLITIIISCVFGKKINYHCEKKTVVNESKLLKKCNTILIINLLFLIIDFAYIGKVPLLSPSVEGFRDYEGIPFFGALFTNLFLFISTLSIYGYFKTKNRKYMICWLFSFVPGVLLFSRALIVLQVLSATLLYGYFYRNKMHKSKLLKLFICALIFLFSFGFAGNIRINQEILKYNDESIIANGTNSEAIKKIGLATRTFEESIIPDEYFWSYIYIASPLANLQNILDCSQMYDFDFDDVFQVVFMQMLPDVISKKINGELHVVNLEETPLLNPLLTVSTFYAKAALSMGYFGMIFMYVYMTLIIYVYYRLLRFFKCSTVLGMAVLSPIVYLSMFDNIFIYSGWSFQLIFPFFIKEIKVGI